MFEWPNATPVHLQSYARRHLYEHFCQFEIPLTYRTVQIDVTDLKSYCKSNNVKFSQAIGFILLRANNHIQEFRHRIVDDILVEYEKIIPARTVMTENKVFAFARGVYTDDFAADYQENILIDERVSKGLVPTSTSSNLGHIYITINPWTTQTAVQAPYSKRMASVPVYCVGKMYDDNGRIKVGLGLQVHHGLVDGYHIGHCINIIERHLADPTLIERPFTSTFGH